MGYDSFGYEKRRPREYLPIEDQKAALRAGRSLHEKFRTGLSDALKDESSAGPMYEELAREASELGYPVEAETLRKIAVDERTHWALINEILRKLRG